MPRGDRAGDPRYRSGKLADPEFRRERARKAAAAVHSIDAKIRAVVESAPMLSPEQVDRIRRALPPVAAPADQDGGRVA